MYILFLWRGEIGVVPFDCTACCSIHSRALFHAIPSIHSTHPLSMFLISFYLPRFVFRKYCRLHLHSWVSLFAPNGCCWIMDCTAYFQLQWNLQIKDTLGSAFSSSVERLFFSRRLKMNSTMEKGSSSVSFVERLFLFQRVLYWRCYRQNLLLIGWISLKNPLILLP